MNLHDVLANQRATHQHNRDPKKESEPSDTFKGSDGLEYACVRPSSLQDERHQGLVPALTTHGRPVLKFLVTLTRADGSRCTRRFTSTLALSENRIRDILRESPEFEHIDLKVRIR